MLGTFFKFSMPRTKQMLISSSLLPFLKHIKRIQSQNLTHPSADRNSQPILNALQQFIDVQTPDLKLLEIASGSGQHAAYFAPHFKNVTFLTSEYSREMFRSIRAYAAACASGNMCKPVYIDITKDVAEWQDAKFPANSFDYMFNSNMMHISPWECSVGLFRAAGQLLKTQGMLFTYGPYAVDGVLEPKSNQDFNASLRSRNAEWGVRDLRDLRAVAEKQGLVIKQTIEMPSNNKFIIWQKT